MRENSPRWYYVCATITWSLANLLAMPTTTRPASASLKAVAAPIPALAPVTTATRPFFKLSMVMRILTFGRCRLNERSGRLNVRRCCRRVLRTRLCADGLVTARESGSLNDGRRRQNGLRKTCEKKLKKNLI